MGLRLPSCATSIVLNRDDLVSRPASMRFHFFIWERASSLEREKWLAVARSLPGCHIQGPCQADQVGSAPYGFSPRVSSMVLLSKQGHCFLAMDTFNRCHPSCEPVSYGEGIVVH